MGPLDALALARASDGELAALLARPEHAAAAAALLRERLGDNPEQVDDGALDAAAAAHDLTRAFADGTAGALPVAALRALARREIVPGLGQWMCRMAVAAAVAVGAVGTAGAQQLELTAFAGLRLGGEFEDGTTAATRELDESPSFGIIAGFPLGQDRTLEIVWSHQEGRVGAGSDGGDVVELDLDAVTLGGTYEWQRERTRPFVSGTGGLMVLSPEAAGFDRDVLLAFTLGGGVKVPISQHVALRLEGRGMLTVAVGGTAGVCGGGGCALSFSGAGIGQLELLAGLTWSR